MDTISPTHFLPKAVAFLTAEDSLLRHRQHPSSLQEFRSRNKTVINLAFHASAYLSFATCHDYDRLFRFMQEFESQSNQMC